MDRDKLLHALSHDLKKPLLLLHGSGDLCVDIRGSHEYFDQVQYGDKDMIVYTNKCHVLLSEDEITRNQYLKDMCTFVSELTWNNFRLEQQTEEEDAAF